MVGINWYNCTPENIKRMDDHQRHMDMIFYPSMIAMFLIVLGMFAVAVYFIWR